MSGLQDVNYPAGKQEGAKGTADRSFDTVT